MPYNYRKAFLGKTNQRRLKSAVKAYNGKNAARKRSSTLRQVRSAFKTYGPMVASALSGAGDYGYKPHGYSRGGHGVTSYRRGYHGFNKDGGSMSSSKKAHGASIGFSKEKGTMTICHSEYIGVLVSSGTTGTSNFVQQSYAINPANAGTFPWLSSTAINFQEYKFNKLVFEYRPYISESTSTSAATLTSMGAVVMATQYNSVNGAFPTYQQMIDSDYAVSLKPSEHGVHAIECNPRYNPLGVMYTSAQTSLTVGANSSDIRMQNLGIFTIASSNIPIANSTALSLGEIHCHYEVCLEKPIINAFLGGLQSAHYKGLVASQAAPLGTTAIPTAAANNLLSLIFTSAAAGFPAVTTNATGFSFPLQITSGSYLCVYNGQVAATTTFVLGSFAAAVTNGTLLACWSNPSSSQVEGAPQQAGAATINVMISFIVQVNAPGSALCNVQLPITTLGTNFTNFDLFVTPYNSLMLV